MSVVGGVLLLGEIALSFYNVGTIWAHEADIFRSWRLIDAEAFHRVQATHWRKLPYWVLAPVGLAVAGGVALIWVHPVRLPWWAIWANLGLQVTSHGLTAALWAPGQARLSRDPRGPISPWLDAILRTHWIRTALTNAYALALLAGAVAVVAR